MKLVVRLVARQVLFKYPKFQLPLIGSVSARWQIAPTIEPSASAINFVFIVPRGVNDAIIIIRVDADGFVVIVD